MGGGEGETDQPRWKTRIRRMMLQREVHGRPRKEMKDEACSKLDESARGKGCRHKARGDGTRQGVP